MTQAAQVALNVCGRTYRSCFDAEAERCARIINSLMVTQMTKYAFF